MSRITTQDLVERAERLGLALLIWRPGDGWTRYEVNVKDERSGALHPISSILNIRECLAYLKGFEAYTTAQHIRRQLGRPS